MGSTWHIVQNHYVVLYAQRRPPSSERRGSGGPERANAGLRRPELLPVDALPASDSAWGVRQMVGNVWEWTATTFYPFPGYPA